MEDYIKKFAGHEVDRLNENLSYVAANIVDWQSFNIKQGDIFVAAYPKCGTHWMKYFIWGILHKGVRPPDMNEMDYGRFFLQLEYSGTKLADMVKSPRPFRTHLPAELVHFSPQAKYIHVTRNPFDSCLSYYNYQKQISPQYFEDNCWDRFFDDFMEGKVYFGDYFQHVLGWYERKDEDNYLQITYEEMIKDHRGSILRVAKFLGEDYYRDIASDEELLKKIEYHSSFSFMSSLPKLRSLKPNVLFASLERGDYDALADDNKFTSIDFFGKGKVGLFKTAFSEEQKQKMHKKMEEKFRNTDLLHQWDEYLRDS